MRRNLSAVLILLSIFLGPCRADDLVLRDGTVYKNYKVLSHDAGFLTILYADGGGKIPLNLLPDSMQKQYGYDAAKALAAQQATDSDWRKSQAQLQVQQQVAIAPPTVPPASPAPPPAQPSPEASALSDPDSPESQASLARINSLEHQIVNAANTITMAATRTTSPDSWNNLNAKTAEFEKEVLSNPLTKSNEKALAQIVQMRSGQILIAKNNCTDPNCYRSFVHDLLADPLPAVATMAKQEAQPVELKFTSVDGKQVDLAQLRGKVVLVDFWASWCPLCWPEVPSVVAAYKKFHDQGFEVVGISLDNDKGTVTSYAWWHGMVWPQYFDGASWNSTLVQKMGVRALPSMWLLGKDGVVITTNANEGLAGKVEQLLKSP